MTAAPFSAGLAGLHVAQHRSGLGRRAAVAPRVRPGAETTIAMIFGRMYLSSKHAAPKGYE